MDLGEVVTNLIINHPVFRSLNSWLKNNSLRKTPLLNQEGKHQKRDGWQKMTMNNPYDFGFSIAD
jgi:hypothetical protein